jgi:acetoin utilization protein AcuC
MFPDVICGGKGAEFYIPRPVSCATFARALNTATSNVPAPVLLVAGERLARYGFGDGHPFGPDRHAAFLAEFAARGLDKRVRTMETRAASRDELESFHTRAYVDRVAAAARTGAG